MGGGEGCAALSSPILICPISANDSGQRIAEARRAKCGSSWRDAGTQYAEPPGSVTIHTRVVSLNQRCDTVRVLASGKSDAADAAN